MALRALRDTYGTESIYGCEVRRFIKAGTIVPPHYINVDPVDVEEGSNSGLFLMGAVTAPPPLPQQIKPKDYSGMTLDTLKEEALSHGIVVTPGAKKSDIVEALTKAT